MGTRAVRDTGRIEEGTRPVQVLERDTITKPIEHALFGRSLDLDRLCGGLEAVGARPDARRRGRVGPRTGGGVNKVTISVTQGDVNQVTFTVTLFTPPRNRTVPLTSSGHPARAARDSAARSSLEASERPLRPRLTLEPPLTVHPRGRPEKPDWQLRDGSRVSRGTMSGSAPEVSPRACTRAGHGVNSTDSFCERGHTLGSNRMMALSSRAALSALLFLTAACAERHPGIEVNVSVEASALPDGPARVELDMAKLHVTSVRGVPCGEALARALQPISSAWAHGGSASGGDPLTATIAVPVDLRRAGPQPLATLRPPPGRWCGLEVGVGPDEETATSLLVDARRQGATRRYLSASTRLVRVDRWPLALDSPGAHDVTLFLDAGPALASLEPAVNDARRELLDTLLASMRWTSP